MSAAGRGGVRRAGDAHQTPPELCRRLVGLPLLTYTTQMESPGGDGLRMLEPSAGAGRFVDAMMRRWPSARVAAVEPDRELTPAGQLGQTWHGTLEAYAPGHRLDYDLICGNPPYSLAEQHVRICLDLLAPGGTLAFLLRLAFLESQARLPLWRAHPATHIYVLSERPSFTDGGTDAAAYGFFVWQLGVDRRHAVPTVLEVISWKGDRVADAVVSANKGAASAAMEAH